MRVCARGPPRAEASSARASRRVSASLLVLPLVVRPCCFFLQVTVWTGSPCSEEVSLGFQTWNFKEVIKLFLGRLRNSGEACGETGSEEPSELGCRHQLLLLLLLWAAVFSWTVRLYFLGFCKTRRSLLHASVSSFPLQLRHRIPLGSP